MFSLPVQKVQCRLFAILILQDPSDTLNWFHTTRVSSVKNEIVGDCRRERALVPYATLVSYEVFRQTAVRLQFQLSAHLQRVNEDVVSLENSRVTVAI